ncbi:MAG: FkbM family methyltransferase [Acidobacteria bacterium]|nr:FkbM family methyltransferase [Acidobacteriota bacterium]
MRIRLILLAILVLVLAGVVVYRRTSPPADVDPEFHKLWTENEETFREIMRLDKKYGGKMFSQFHEELIIRDFFQNETHGFFVDVGASHYKEHSTTYYLEKYLGWSGIAIDALAEYHAGYKMYRPRTEFFNFFVSDHSDDVSHLYVVEENKRLSTGYKEFVKEEQGEVSERTLPTITLNDLLVREGVEKIDFLSMDIELSEPAALRGFDIRRYGPRLVCIEVHAETQEFIEAYFAKNDYVELVNYSRIDPLNRYYAPRVAESTPANR